LFLESHIILSGGIQVKKALIAVVMALCVSFFAVGCSKEKEQGKAEPAVEKEMKAAAAQELSATVVSTAAGRTMSMKVYMKPDKYRSDDESTGTATIVRKDLNKVWTIIKPQSVFMEMQGVTEEQSKAADLEVKGEVSRKAIGNETIGGHPSTKYEVTAKVGNEAVTTHMWWATDINFPVKTAAVDGSWSMEYRDINLCKQPDSLFEVPEGYTKMSIPGMPGGHAEGKIPKM